MIRPTSEKYFSQLQVQGDDKKYSFVEGREDVPNEHYLCVARKISLALCFLFCGKK